MIRFINGIPKYVWFSQHANGEAFKFEILRKDASGKRVSLHSSPISSPSQNACMRIIHSPILNSRSSSQPTALTPSTRPQEPTTTQSQT